VLVARELPGRRRAWPYVVAGLVVGLIGFARLYLGAHWLSDVLAGILLGMVFITGLGLAYRRRILRSFWARPLSLTFFLTVLLAAGWHGPRVAEATLARFEPPRMELAMGREDWWRDSWRVLPAHRDERPGTRSWPLNVEYAGELDALRARLEAQGWSAHAQAGWLELLQVLASDAAPEDQAILPAAHQGRAESLLISLPGDALDHRVGHLVDQLRGQLVGQQQVVRGHLAGHLDAGLLRELDDLERALAASAPSRRSDIAERVTSLFLSGPEHTDEQAELPLLFDSRSTGPRAGNRPEFNDSAG
jgi:hypothetical protein